MDYEHICSKEGYRVEDLGPANQEIMRALYFIEEQFEEGCKYNVLEEWEGDPLHRQLYNSIGHEVLKEAVDYLHSEILGFQICLAEEEAQREEGN